jgi:hypothetical protein
MLELLTGEGSIASHGLSYILNPQRFGPIRTTASRALQNGNLFGAKFVYWLDRNLQVFFAKTAKWDPDDPLSVDPNYLRNKAENLLEKIDDGNTLGTILPSTIYGPAGAKRAIEQEAVGGRSAPNKKGKANPNKHPPAAARPNHAAPLTAAALLASAEVSNDRTVPEWLLPKGSQYYDFFLSKDKSTRGGHYSMTPVCPMGLHQCVSDSKPPASAGPHVEWPTCHSI